ncbi:MAG: ATP-binding protein [Cyclobacterium sp.]|uniref:AAA family ATPase n=1 Tax=Cyclobacterium sp. TaxID=1966343 RepID=UPI0039705121
MLVLVMGLPGSGKSFFAKRLAAVTGMTYLNSDQVRIEMGVRGKYSEEDRQKVYAAMAARSEERLGQGVSVLVDATFQRQKNRIDFQKLASRKGHLWAGIRVWADENLIKKRLSSEREMSDADFLVYQKLKADFDPLEGDYLLIQSEDGCIESMIQEALKYLKRYDEG